MEMEMGMVLQADKTVPSVSRSKLLSKEILASRALTESSPRPLDETSSCTRGDLARDRMDTRTKKRWRWGWGWGWG